MQRSEDDRFDGDLRRFLDAESQRLEGFAVSASSVAARVRQTARPAPVLRRRPYLLVAAAVLVGGSIAAAGFGSGILRMPSTDPIDGPIQTPGPTAVPTPTEDIDSAWTMCHGGLVPDEVVLSAGFETDGEAQQLQLDRDGLLLAGPMDATGATPWTSQRLTEAGVQHLLDLVTTTGARGACGGYLAAETDTNVTARRGGALGQMGWGPSWGSRITVQTIEERDALLMLGDILRRPQAWLTASDWVELAATPWIAEEWQVRVGRSDALAETAEGPDPNAILLPDGSTLTTFGEDSPLGYGCGMVTLAERRDIEAALDAAGAPPNMTPWQFSGVENIVVISPQLPHWPGCAELPLPPAPEPTASRDLERDPCSLVGDVQASEILGVDVHGDAHLSIIDNGRDCIYHSAANWSTANVALRQRSTSSADARALLDVMFHRFTEEPIPGGILFVNDCKLSVAPCAPSIALSVEPSFAVVITEERTDPEDMRALADAVAEAFRP